MSYLSSYGLKAEIRALLNAVVRLGKPTCFEVITVFFSWKVPLSSILRLEKVSPFALMACAVKSRLPCSTPARLWVRLINQHAHNTHSLAIQCTKIKVDIEVWNAFVIAQNLLLSEAHRQRERESTYMRIPWRKACNQWTEICLFCCF